MGAEVNCNNCIYAEQDLKKKSIMTEYQKVETNLKCSIGYRVLPGGKPDLRCSGKFFESKKI